MQAWDTEMCINLARRILETVVPKRPSKPVQTMSLDQVVAILKSDTPPRTDEECRKTIEEERLKNTDDSCLIGYKY